MLGSTLSVEDAILQSVVFKAADIVVLDLQTASENELSYLEQSFDEGCPPVLVFLPENSEQAVRVQNVFKDRSVEFVAKPLLSQLDADGETLRLKLRSIVMERRNNVDVFPG